jgi:hypothetical protein
MTIDHRVHAAGNDERDRNVRAALRKRVLDEALEAAAAPEDAVYPGMGEQRWGRPREDQLSVRIPPDGFHRLTEKIVRGIFYVVDQKFIEPPWLRCPRQRQAYNYLPPL